MSNYEKLQIIYDSYINGQMKQMAEQIIYYGMRKFWEDMRNWMNENCLDMEDLTNILIIYMRIVE